MREKCGTFTPRSRAIFEFGISSTSTHSKFGRSRKCSRGSSTHAHSLRYMTKCPCSSSSVQVQTSLSQCAVSFSIMECSTPGANVVRQS